MPDRQPDVQGDQLIGPQEAARYLGVHRSTLHIAIKHHLIVPDERTPGGHARFHIATLEAFRSRLARESATGEAGALAPLLALADMSRQITEMPPLVEETHTLNDLAQTAVDGILSVVRGTDTCYVAQKRPTTQTPYGLKLLAQHGVPEKAVAELVRRQARFTFATTNVMVTRQREVVTDTSQARLHGGTQQSMRLSPVGAYAIVPILRGDEAIGVIGCISQRPRQYSAFDLTFIEGVAHELAVAMHTYDQHDYNASLVKAVTFSGELIHQALAWRANLVDPVDEVAEADTAPLPPSYLRMPQSQISYLLPKLTQQQEAALHAMPSSDSSDEDVSPAQRLERLRESTVASERTAHAVSQLANLFINLSKAQVVCTTGFDVNWPTTDQRLLALAQRVADGGEPTREMWPAETGDTVHTALAVRVALRAGCFGSVAAVWPGMRPWRLADQTLLETFATLFLLITTASDK